ncbi:MAG: NAD(P)/FAD-dependent oxidoreductase [Fimbriimonadaceae bacterium]|nr:MAG: NAD(P)/FAD-dependent oxidoreductase [Fimbriimonadaceae bacterium]
MVIAGAGFGGLQAARSLKRAPVEVLVIDRQNHHLFQPLLYQVATAGLSPADIAVPIRRLLRGQENAEVLMAEVREVDAQQSIVRHSMGEVRYDYLVLATGVRHAYFGNDAWEADAPGLKTLDDAVAIRRKVLVAFERAEASTDPSERAGWLTFVIVGGGATGVELAGSLAELSRRALSWDFRRIDPAAARIVLIEAGDRVMASFDPKLSRFTLEALESLGVETRLGAKVTDVHPDGVETTEGRIEARTVIWAAGVQATRATGWLDAPRDRVGRIRVLPDCRIPGLPNLFAIGDAMTLKGSEGEPLPGIAQVAMQQGKFVAGVIAREVRGQRPAEAFRYKDKGNMATIGRRLAIAELGSLRLKGALAWLIWVFVHIWYLIDFQNRVLVFLKWIWAYATFHRGARLITGVDAERDPNLSNPQDEGNSRRSNSN